MSSTGPNRNRAANDSRLPYSETLSDEAWARVASWVISSLETGKRTNARAVLDEHPVLANNPNAILRLALEEFSQAVRAGEAIDVDAFVRRFPEVSERLRQDIELFMVLRSSRDSSLMRSGETLDIWPVTGERFADYLLGPVLGGGPESRVFHCVHEPSMTERVIKLTRSPASEIAVRRSISASRVVPIDEPCRDSKWPLVGLPMPVLGKQTVHDFYERAWKRHRRPGSIKESPEFWETLEEWLPKETRISHYSDLVLHLALQIAYGLEELHHAGYVHGDVKPANLLLGSDSTIYLLDFDLAHPINSPFQRLGGTPQFAAPEHLIRLVDDRSDERDGVANRSIDVFGFGATIYLLATGRFPFGWLRSDLSRSEATQALLEKHRMGPKPLRALASDFDRRVSLVLEKCLAFRPEHRPESMKPIIRVLERSLQSRAIRYRRLYNRFSSATGSLIRFLKAPVRSH